MCRYDTRIDSIDTQNVWKSTCLSQIEFDCARRNVNLRDMISFRFFFSESVAK